MFELIGYVILFYSYLDDSVVYIWMYLDWSEAFCLRCHETERCGSKVVCAFLSFYEDFVFEMWKTRNGYPYTTYNAFVLSLVRTNLYTLSTHFCGYFEIVFYYVVNGLWPKI